MIRRLFWDIETSPNVVLSWRVGYKLNIDDSNIIKERSIICIGYKWEHEKHAQCLVWDKSQSDKTMLQKFLRIANSADELVAHNGDSFDMPWFLTRCAFHGIRTFPAYKTIDTLQWARRRFYFNSNKLNYIAGYLGIGHKLHTEFNLWKAICLHNCKKSLAHMADYCKRDVELLEKVWKRLAEISKPKTHVGVLDGNARWTCPHDGSERVKISKTKITAAGTIQYQMQCNQCGSYYSISRAAKEEYDEAKKK